MADLRSQRGYDYFTVPYYNGGSKVQAEKTDLETRVCNTGEN